MEGLSGAGERALVPAADQGRARMMVGRAFLAQNVGVGAAFGGFGVSVLPLQQAYGATTAMAALALSLCVLVLGLVSPLVGTLIGRIGLRWTMIMGAVISGVGYALLSVAPNMGTVLLLYAVPLGIGLAMFGPFPSSVLASNWYPHNPGPALGIANMPLLVALLPMVGLVVIRDHGLATFYLILAALHLALIPFLLGVSDGPPRAGRPTGEPAHGTGTSGMLSTREVLASPAFWALALGAGFLNAVGITGVSHLAAVVAERGVAPSEGAGLLAIMGGSAVLGSLAVGFLCGKLGASRTLALIAAALALSWLAMMGTSAFPVMAICVLVVGACGAGVFPAVNMLSAGLFGQLSLPRVIGLFGMVTLPLTFGVPPVVGLLRDAVGRYGPVIGILIAGCVATALVFLLSARSHSRAASSAPAAA
jgi:cyanate permease